MGMLDNLSPLWVENQYNLWKSEPEKLSEEWRAFFTGFDLGCTKEAPSGVALTTEDALKHSAVQSLIYRYRDVGHLLACTDPLSPCLIEHPLYHGSKPGNQARLVHRSQPPCQRQDVIQSHSGSVYREFLLGLHAGSTRGKGLDRNGSDSEGTE